MTVMEASKPISSNEIHLQNLPHPPTENPIEAVAYPIFAEQVHPPTLLPFPAYPPVLSAPSALTHSISNEKAKDLSINAKSADLKGETNLEKIARRIEERKLFLINQEEQLAKEAIVQKRKAFIRKLEHDVNHGYFWPNTEHLTCITDEVLILEIQASRHFSAIIKRFCEVYLYPGIAPFLKMEKAVPIIKETICKFRIDGCLKLRENPSTLSSFLHNFSYIELETIKHQLSLLIEIGTCFENKCINGSQRSSKNILMPENI